MITGVSVASEYLLEGRCEVKLAWCWSGCWLNCLAAGPVTVLDIVGRQRSMELVEGVTESRAGQMLLAAWLGWAAEWLGHAGQGAVQSNVTPFSRAAH